MKSRSHSTRLLLPLSLALLAPITRAGEIYPKLRTLPGHEGSVLSVRLTRDEKTLVSGSRDDTIKVWDFATGKLQRTIKPAEGDADIYALAFSRDGKVLASSGRYKTITLWDAATFKPIRKLEGHEADVRMVEFSPDARTLASVGEDFTFRLWDVATGRLKVTRREHQGKVKSVAYSPDGRTIVTAALDATVRLWDAETGEPRQVIRGASKGLEFCEISPNGRILFGGTGDIGQLLFWDARTGKILRDLPTAHGNQHGLEIDSGTFTPDSRLAISGSKDRTILFWDMRTFTERHSISGLPGRIESMTLSRDGKTLVTGFGGTDFTIAVWDLDGLLD